MRESDKEQKGCESPINNRDISSKSDFDKIIIELGYFFFFKT